MMLILLSLLTQPAFSAMETAPCQTVFQSSARITNYGATEEQNCQMAKNAAELANLYYCYTQGHSDCLITASRKISSSAGRCEVESRGKSGKNSLCRPDLVYIAEGHGGNKNSIEGNCQEAISQATQVALDNCYNAGHAECAYKSHFIHKANTMTCTTRVAVRAKE